MKLLNEIVGYSLLAACTLVSVCAGWAQHPKVAFASDRSGRFQIWTADPTNFSGTLFQVTTAGGGNQVSRSPSWSQVKGQIAYQFGASGVRGIHVINPDGTNDQQVTPPFNPCGDDSDPAWSPDGNFIAYTCLNSGHSDIYVHDFSSGQENPLVVLTPTNQLRPAWSPDGTQVAFVSAQGAHAVVNVLNINSHTINPLTFGTAVDFDPAWSPDGRQIAFSSTRIGNRHVYVESSTCPEVVQNCPAATQITIAASNDTKPAWAPDGKTLVFESNRSGKNQLYSLDPSQPESNTNPAVLISDGLANDQEPAWQPIAQSLDLAKALGNPLDIAGGCGCGHPINAATGNSFEQVTDYETAGPNKLRFARSYNSSGLTANPNTWAKALGVNWRSMYDRYLTMISLTSVTAERADGQVLTFTLNAGVWASDTDVDVTLAQSGSTWTLRDHDDTAEIYSIVGTKGTLTSMTLRGGYTQTLQYNGIGQLTSVTDTYNRLLQITYYSNGLLNTVTTPDGLVLTYGYNSSGVNGPVLDRLASITYSTTPASGQSYLYQNSALPFALTGIIDEDGNPYATWTYDGIGRGLTSQLGSGANLTTISYDDTTGNRTVTNALGEQEIYKFTALQGVSKVTEIDRQVTTTTAAATRLFTYDTNGYTASATDWNGNLTTYVNDVHGDPIAINEAVGTPVARTSTIVYDPTFVHLLSTVTTQGVVTSYAYDANENVLTTTLTDTTTQTGYLMNGTTRTWTNTWQNFLLASAKTPNGNLTQYGYDSTGTLISTTNALFQVTKIMQHTGGGYPLVVVDSNNVTTTLTYDARSRLLSSTVSASNQPSFTTTNTNDPAGNLTSFQLPDNSKLTYGYDMAHRLISTTDLFGNATTYTLDALGNITLTKLTNPQITLTRQHSGVFDALGRVLQDIGGVGQTTKYAYDNNGNTVTITDPDGNVTQKSFDALNRLSTVTDAAAGTTTNAYDQHDRIISVTDPNNNVTSYVYDGFGDRIQTVSPDTHATVFYYDRDSNLVLSKNATGAVAKYTYDALDRVLTTNYPSDTAENVVFTYDQANHGFGIGRITSVKDAVGTLTRTYDERGNMLTEKRVNGSTTLTIAYAYDPASRVSSVTYPSGTVVSYTRDSMGRIIGVSAKVPGARTFVPVASGIGYEPFGPVDALTYGNAVNETNAFDLDYRLTTLTDQGAALVQKLVYGYDPANNVLSIADKVTVADSQAFLYDKLNRLANATGAYGSQAWTYDPVGNRLTQTASGVMTTYGYVLGSNRVASITTGGITQAVGTTAAGNINSFSPGFNSVTSLTYNQANRLATTNAGTSQLTQYTYDAFGQRMVKLGSTGTTLFQYDQNGHLLEQMDGTGSSQVDYIYLADRPLAAFQPSNAKMYFLHDDRLGTPQRATDSMQTVAWSADYQPFGYTSTGIGVIVQNVRLPGQEFEVETWWNHNGFRDYAPTLGRYLEADPIGITGFISEGPLGISGQSSYSYTGGNPVTNTDPYGLISTSKLWEGAALLAGGAVIVAGAGAIAVASTGAAAAFVATTGGALLTTAALTTGLSMTTFGLVNTVAGLAGIEDTPTSFINAAGNSLFPNHPGLVSTVDVSAGIFAGGVGAVYGELPENLELLGRMLDSVEVHRAILRELNRLSVCKIR